jgi:hypothetical protein
MRNVLLFFQEKSNWNEAIYLISNLLKNETLKQKHISLWLFIMDTSSRFFYKKTSVQYWNSLTGIT